MNLENLLEPRNEFSSQSPFPLAQCSQAARGEAPVAVEVSIAPWSRIQRSLCCFSRGCRLWLRAVLQKQAEKIVCVSTVLPSQLQQWSPVCLDEATSPVVAGTGHSVFSRISQMCLNFQNKDLFTPWKILAVNERIRLWSLRMNPGIASVCFSLVLLVGSTLGLGSWVENTGSNLALRLCLKLLCNCEHK